MGARAAVWAATPTPCVSASGLPPPPDSVPPTVPPSPGGCGRTVSEGPAGKDETTRCVIVVTLVTGGVSRSALGPSVAWGGGTWAFHHLRRRLPVWDSGHLAVMNGCQLRLEGLRERRRGWRNQAEAPRLGGSPVHPSDPLSRLPVALEQERGKALEPWGTSRLRFSNV